jgi:hypothetical protein
MKRSRVYIVRRVRTARGTAKANTRLFTNWLPTELGLVLLFYESFKSETSKALGH